MDLASFLNVTVLLTSLIANKLPYQTVIVTYDMAGNCADIWLEQYGTDFTKCGDWLKQISKFSGGKVIIEPCLLCILLFYVKKACIALTLPSLLLSHAFCLFCFYFDFEPPHIIFFFF